MPIFTLRLFDLGVFMQESLDEIRPLIMDLFNQHIYHIQVLNLQGLYFCLEICKRLKLAKEDKLLLQMLTALIQRFKQIGEEVALLESLDLAKEFSKEYEEDFRSLTSKTRYYFFRKKFLNEDVIGLFPLGEQLVSFLNSGNSSCINCHST